MIAVLARRLGARATLIDPGAPSGGADGFCSWTQSEMAAIAARAHGDHAKQSWWHHGSDATPFFGLNVVRGKFGRAPLSGHQHKQRTSENRGPKWISSVRNSAPPELLVDDAYDDDDLELSRRHVERTTALAKTVKELPPAQNFSQFTTQRRLPPPGPNEVRLRASDVVNRCGAVLGYRACAAVPAIVEYCVANKKPFCILPCCSYPVNGERCNNVAEMTDKLQAAHPAIKQDVVDGSGTVLWCTFGRPWY